MHSSGFPRNTSQQIDAPGVGSTWCCFKVITESVKRATQPARRATINAKMVFPPNSRAYWGMPLVLVDVAAATSGLPLPFVADFERFLRYDLV